MAALSSIRSTSHVTPVPYPASSTAHTARLSPPSPPPPPAPTYTILNIYGTGTHSTVYKAIHCASQTICALKRSSATHPFHYPNVLREGAFLMALQEKGVPHVPICKEVLTVETSAGPECILVMEPVEKTSLSQGYSKDGKIEVSLFDAITIGKQSLEFLHAFDHLGMIHGDIKPHNLLYNDKEKTLLVADFESAREVAKLTFKEALTTLQYRAPEMILGQPFNQSSDIWSLGCSLFECFTGEIFTPTPDGIDLQVSLDLQLRYLAARVGLSSFDYLASCPQTAIFFTTNPSSSKITGFVGTPKPIPLEPWEVTVKKTAALKGWPSEATTQVLALLHHMLQCDPRLRLPPKTLLQCPLFTTDVSFILRVDLPSSLVGKVDRFEFFLAPPAVEGPDESTDSKTPIGPVLTISPTKRERCLHLPASRTPYIICAKNLEGENLCTIDKAIITEGDIVNFTVSEDV